MAGQLGCLAVVTRLGPSSILGPAARSSQGGSHSGGSVNNVKRGALVAAIALGAPLVTAAAASAHHAVLVCDYTDNTLVQIWFQDGSDLTNPTGNDSHYSEGGTVHTGKPCPTAKDGKDGTNGKDGAKGDTGATGAKGEKGATGATGATGAPGATGAAGAKGDKGDTGAVGPIGATGSAGAAGATGADGVAGPAGPAGDVGPAGPTGPGGLPGLNGVDGVAGLPGAVGPAGANGEVGATGAAGAQGIPGLNGVDGTNGKDGKAGVNKTVIVHADGTQEVVDGLPHTGADNTVLWAIAGFGLAAVAGGALVLRSRRA